MATKRFPIHPARPELICWGCDRYCAADAMACGNGSDRTQHPAELFGPDWAEWAEERAQQTDDAASGLQSDGQDTPASP